jgi:hypothetical protein
MAHAELQRIQLRGAPLHAAIGRAFDEVDARHGREAQDVLHRENQWPLDQAMDHQSVLVRIDVGPAGMIALEKQPVRRDDAVQVLQRREADGGFGAGGEPRHVAPDHAGLGVGGPAIGPVDHAGSERLRPRRFGGRGSRSRFRMGRSGAKREAAGQCGAEAEKRTAGEPRIR